MGIERGGREKRPVETLAEDQELRQPGEQRVGGETFWRTKLRSMIDGQIFTDPKPQGNPPTYRVWFYDGTGLVEIGSISEHMLPFNWNYWHWGVDTMPRMGHGGRAPSGDNWTLEAAKRAFKAAFIKWVNEHADKWPSNRDYIQASRAGRN